jgi:hypothetical protein
MRRAAPFAPSLTGWARIPCEVARASCRRPVREWQACRTAPRSRDLHRTGQTQHGLSRDVRWATLPRRRLPGLTLMPN